MPEVVWHKAYPKGALLTVDGDGTGTAMYVTVQWKDEELLVFPQDLLERAVECKKHGIATLGSGSPVLLAPLRSTRL
jgi:hypothetical protein